MNSFDAIGESILLTAEGQRQLSAAFIGAIGRALRHVANRFRQAETPFIR